MRVAAVLLFAGSGVRTRLETPKQFLKIAGKTVMEHTICAFCKSPQLDRIVVVGNPSFLPETNAIVAKANDPRLWVEAGGASRQESSLLGVRACSDASHVLIHDGARPLISTDIIHQIIDALQFHDAVDVCIPSPDTVVVRSGDFIDHIPSREHMMLGQTPQGFSRSVLLKAHEQARSQGFNEATDDCTLVMRIGVPVKIVAGDRANMKLTHLDDLYLLERIFQVARLAEVQSRSSRSAVPERCLIIGGTQGIGGSLAALLTKMGTDVLSVGRNTVPGIDVGSRDSASRFLKQLRESGQTFDAIVYAPGFLVLKSIENYSEEDWDHTFSVNLKGVFLILQQLRTLLAKGGHFVVVGSGNYSRGRAGFSAYGSSKAALINLIQTAAEEYPEFQLNVISPQRTNTAMRTRVFGVEPLSTLLDPKTVAQEIIRILGTTSTGMNFDVRIDAPLLSMDVIPGPASEPKAAAN